jgi:hypothetical protein
MISVTKKYTNWLDNYTNILPANYKSVSEWQLKIDNEKNIRNEKQKIVDEMWFKVPLFNTFTYEPYMFYSDEHERNLMTSATVKDGTEAYIYLNDNTWKSIYLNNETDYNVIEYV